MAGIAVGDGHAAEGCVRDVIGLLAVCGREGSGVAGSALVGHGHL